MNITQTQFKEITKKLTNEFCSNYSYDIAVDGWHILLISKWTSSRKHYIEIDACNNGIQCFYILENDNTATRYPDYLTFVEMQDISKIIFNN